MKALIFGAGNIGRGFIGQLFFQSAYEIVFVDVNRSLVDQLNRDHGYTIHVVSDATNEEIQIEHVRAVHVHDLDSVAAEICQADLVATAVGVDALVHIAWPIAHGLSRRWQEGNETPLDILVCENLMGANRALRQWVADTLSDHDREMLADRAGFVETSIGRMVPVMTPEMQGGMPLRVMVEPYCELPVDRDGFKGNIPVIKNMIPASPFDYYIQRKLYIHNMGHAMLAYLGQAKGYRYIWESVRDPDIRQVCHAAMSASALALSRERGVDYNEIEQFIDDLMRRFDNRQLHDTVIRVGRDRIRKLSPNDRLMGAFHLCLRQGVNPASICVGILAALKAGDNTGADFLDVPDLPALAESMRKICISLFDEAEQEGAPC